MKYVFTVFFIFFLISSTIFSQDNISVGNTYSQNFTIGTSATATLLGSWKMSKNASSVRTVDSYSSAVTATEQRAGNSMSSSATNGLYNYAAGDPTTATERAIGGISSGTGSKSVNMYVWLKNNGGSQIQSLSISYNVEKYRNGTNPAGFSIQMYYSSDGSSWTSAGSNFLTSFSADADNNGFATAPGSTVQVYDKLLVVNINANANLYLAWNYSVTTGTTTTFAQALGIDDVSITANATPTPVQLNSFYATILKNGVQLNWSTATETQNYGWNIERQIINSENINLKNEWEKIGFVKGAANSNSQKSYSFIDQTAYLGEYHYRLKQIDLDGSYEYSDALSIKVDNRKGSDAIIFDTYPNPFNSETVLNYEIPSPQQIKISVYNSLGENVQQLFNEYLSAGKYKLPISLNNLPSGAYFIRLESGTKFFTKKIILLK